MERRLVAADQPAWDRYLDALAQLSELVASGGTMGSYPADPRQQKAWQAEQQRRRDLQTQKKSNLFYIPIRKL